MARTARRFLTLAAAWLALACGPSSAEARGRPGWQESLKRRLALLERGQRGAFGVYVKHLGTGADLSFHGDERWYIASGVKLPIALATLREVDRGALSLDERIQLREDDYVDGAGGTNRLAPGTRVTARFLLEQMLIHSDNTASDALIRRVGLDKINALVSDAVPGAFAPITTLAEVRRQVYSHIDPAARALSGSPLLRLRAVRGDEAKIRALRRLLRLGAPRAPRRTLRQAYDRYYARELNRADLRGYARLLEEAAAGRLLSPASTRLLMDTMSRAATGARRIKAALPPGTPFAHKTGTQRERVCDFGIAGQVAIAVCTRDTASVKRAEDKIRRIARAIVASGVLASGPSAVSPAWVPALRSRLAEVDRRTEGRLGVYVKRLGDGAELRYDADRPWYLASTVKVPIAIALLQRVEEGKTSLDRELVLRASDYVDGTGSVNWKEPGERLSLGYLLDKMLTESDSAAADLLLREVGEGELNRRVRDGMAGRGFARITSLLAVRHDAYSELHPKARELTNMDFIELKKLKDPARKIALLERKLGLARGSLGGARALDEAFERYYLRRLNSATLPSFGHLLERLAKGELLSPEHTRLMLGLMEKAVTGDKRIKAGLPPGVRFAQKTGTQLRRVCNVGILSEPGAPAGGRAVVVACLEGFTDPASAESALQRVGSELAASGLLQGAGGAAAKNSSTSHAVNAG